MATLKPTAYQLRGIAADIAAIRNATPEQAVARIWYCLTCGKGGHTLAETTAHGGHPKHCQSAAVNG